VFWAEVGVKWSHVHQSNVVTGVGRAVKCNKTVCSHDRLIIKHNKPITVTYWKWRTLSWPTSSRAQRSRFFLRLAQHRLQLCDPTHRLQECQRRRHVQSARDICGIVAQSADNHLHTYCHCHSWNAHLFPDDRTTPTAHSFIPDISRHLMVTCFQKTKRHHACTRHTPVSLTSF